MRTATTSLLIIAALAICGCKQSGFLAKREAEKCCPTDIRKTVPWCAGEDALFQCPCQPDAAFYGYKPTCWGTWPASGAQWRDMHCGEVHHGAVITDLMTKNRELIKLPAVESVPDLASEASMAEPGSHEANALPAANTINPSAAASDRVPELATTNAETDQPMATERDSQDALPEPIFGPIPLPPIELE